MSEWIHSESTLTATLQAMQRTIAQLTTQGTSAFYSTEITGLALFQRDAPTEPTSSMYEPCVCVIAQGAKHVMLGGESYQYDAQHYLITSVHLPTVVRITQASPEQPYLGLTLKLNLHEISQLMADSHLPAPRLQRSERGMATSKMNLPLLNAFQRLINLLKQPEDIPILAPLIQREIIYRLLTGEQGLRLRQIAAMGSQGNQMARAIEWLKTNYTQTMRIEDLAEQANMSTSTFHHHFRALTAMSPLQYQKWLRLHEARRLMLIEDHDAASASFKVGYESPSQFNREYHRLFGAPPLRDISKLKQLAAA